MVKTTTTRDGVYKKLLTVKKENESFSELFERLVEERNPTRILARLRATLEFTDKEKMLSEISARRIIGQDCIHSI